VARPRVIIASQDPEVAVKMIASLNPKRYRVEHIFDVSEALLRAELVLAHCAVVHMAGYDERIARRCQQSVERELALVIVSKSEKAERNARELGARFVSLPFTTNDLKRSVFRAVSHAHQLRSDQRNNPGKSAPPLYSSSNPKPIQRLLLLTNNSVTGSVMAAVMKSQLGVSCDTATSAREAMTNLEETYDCVIADPELLMVSEDGAAVARKLARRGIPVIPLAPQGEVDVTSAGQAAWDIMPQIRRSLGARDKITQAG